MKKLVTLLIVMFVIVLAGSAMAEVVVTGDMRLRPRMDLKDQTDIDPTDSSTVQKKTTDGYYYYRARLNLKSKLGDGWFGHVQLGTNGFAYWTNKFGDGSKPSGSSVDGAGRGNVDFMLIYFGRKTKKFGYMGGLMPVNGLSNPLLDLHYYSHKMIDVPFFLYSNNGAHGFSGYIGLENGGKINATILVDNNRNKVETIVDGGTPAEVDSVDQYTIILDAPLKVSDFIVQPVVMFTAISQDSTEAPATFGANITTPKVGQFKFYGTFGSSSQSATGTAEYSAWYTRLKAVGKMGKGTLTAWVDIAEKKFDANDYKNKFTYFWLAYAIPVYKSESGSVSIKPTWRHIAEKRETDTGFEYYDFTRDKIELTIDFKFN